ncbi:MAG: hypothetical protein A3E84_01440 [Gammaproteobacteria bacterium RIFCSPHIGHO2_12_FULL_42_13]|nr:MAG: hypothetical protein A3E84_01440 [Gammaproteobacteria bacterium RIFCSPHIGHO2_12_FULL_42_13]
MRKIYILFTTILSLCCIILLTSCGTTKGASEAYQGESEKEIFNNGEEALRSKDYSEAIKRFEALEVQYPFGHDTEIAQLHIIYAYYRKEEYPLAVAAADRFIRLHPVSPHVDYAYYMRGMSDYYENIGMLERVFSINLANRDLTHLQKAFNDFTEFTQRFPNSRYAPSAHQYMIYLRNILADHELIVAEYYYSRKAYMAAANRASEVVRHYEGAPQVPKALVIMVKSYRHLHLAQPEQEAMTVLQYNYPNSDYISAAKNIN